MHRVLKYATTTRSWTSTSRLVAKVVTDVAVGVIRGALGNVLTGTIGKVTANFRAGKDL